MKIKHNGIISGVLLNQFSNFSILYNNVGTKFYGVNWSDNVSFNHARLLPSSTSLTTDIPPISHEKKITYS